MGRHSTTVAAVVPVISPEMFPSRKRKRGENTAVEIEVDVSAPEPPSKKALRKAKKGKTTTTIAPQTVVKPDSTATYLDSGSDEEAKEPFAPPKRSAHGIWIGNLPWTSTKLDLRNFLTKDTNITDEIITRLHMPPPSKSAIAASRQRIKPQNQGFAYVDLSTEEALTEALALSEKLLTGRRVLIKNSKSFEGRPEKTKEDVTSTANTGKPPSKRIFVGNLGFDTTKEALQEHFRRCGEVIDVHVATFEDTGKCKGYGWVEFAELEGGEAAVRGWVNFEEKDDVEDEDDEIAEALADQSKRKKKPRTRKWWVNRLAGRPLRMEFAEGKDVRYKKRYGKEGTARDGETSEESVDIGNASQPGVKDGAIDAISTSKNPSTVRKPFRKVDARTIKPGAALAAAPRLTGSIVESRGKKITFA